MSRENQELQASLLLAGSSGEIRVHAIRGREEVSRPFRYEIDFSTDDLQLDEARGATAKLRAWNAVGERFISGVVENLSVLAHSADRPRFRISVVPRPYLLSLRHGYRIFQDQDVQEIVQQLFADAQLNPKMFHWDLAEKYPKRPYCVQYDESEWAFICRLLEEEGIYFTFEQSEDGHAMVFRDDSSSAPSIDEIPYHHDASLHGAAPRAWDLVSVVRAGEAKVALNDYDMLKPSLDLHARQEVSEAAPLHREWYEYPGGYRVAAEGKRLARVRLEELRAKRNIARARTNVLVAQAGKMAKIAGHPSADGDYFLTGVDLSVRIDAEENSGPLLDKGPPQCELELELLPKAAHFRPARLTPRPRALGLQTARVTGPTSEEIHCDKHGRVKVQFHWDRDGRLADQTSCWIRVAQAHTTGSVMIPRIGWEVLVEFVHGDPDRPVCHGRLYNPLFPPVYELPAEKTVSGHRSESSPGGGGKNEVKFDDAAGAQQVQIHAQRGMSLAVAHDKKAKVAKNEKRSVGADRTVTIGAEETIAVVADENLKVGGSSSLTVGATRAVKVTGEASEAVVGDIQLSVGAAEMMRIGNPVQAVLDLITAAVIQGAQAAAAGAVERAQGALLAPIAPALNAAKGAMGGASKLSGPAGALLSGNAGEMASALGIAPGGSGEGALAALGARPSSDGAGGNGARLSSANALAMAGAVAANPEAALSQASAMAAGAAGAIASGALGKALGSAGGGGGGAGGGDGAAGSGTWGTTVGGAVKETIGAVCAINSVMPITFSVGGSSTESVGAARIELIGGSKSENTGGGKTETVAAYIANVGTDIAIDAGAAMAENIGAAQKQNIGGSHGISSKSAALVTASRLKLKASEKITLKCGQAEVVIGSDGVEVGGLEVTVKGSQELKLDPAAIKPG